MMVPDAIFIVNINTRLKNYQNFCLSSFILWQGCQIININGSLDWSFQYLSDKMLFVGLGSHFNSEIQHPASAKVWQFHLSAHNVWQGYQIAIIDVSLDRSTQYLCNGVLDDSSGRHFYSEIQHPAYRQHIIFT